MLNVPFMLVYLVMIQKLNPSRALCRLLFCRRRRAPKFILELNGLRKAKSLLASVKNSFDSLFDASGVEKTSQSDIENNLTNFYKDLFP